MGGYAALQRYKNRQMYRRMKRLRRQVYAAKKVKERLATVAETAPGSVFSKNLFGASWADANADQKYARRGLSYYGPGDYKSWMNKLIPSGSFSRLGNHLGSVTGIPGLDQAGSWLGNKVSNFVGFGDYGTSVNQIVGGANKGQISVNDSDMSGDVYITQTEFVQNIYCTGTAGNASTFQQFSFPINPGLSNVFPFLSQLAQNFTLYEFQGLMFKFNPTSGENNSTSNSLGKVILATQYDPDAPSFVNSIQMENYDYANSAKPSQTIVHGVETANHQQVVNMQYVRTGVSNKDKIFTDIGTFYVATEGIPFAVTGTQVLGELWVTYRIKLSRSNLYGSLLGKNIGCDTFSGVTSTTALASTVIPRDFNTIGCTVSNQSATSFRISFPSNLTFGAYQVTVGFYDTLGPNYTNQVVVAPSNLTLMRQGDPTGTALTSIPFTPISFRGPQTLAATTFRGLTQTMFFLVEAPGTTIARVDINVSSALTNSTAFYLFISAIDSTVLTSV